MEEKEIIKYNGNFKNIAKKIVIITLVLTIACFFIFGIREYLFDIALDKRKNEANKLETIYEEKKNIKEEKYNIYLKDKSDKSYKIYEEASKEAEQAYDNYVDKKYEKIDLPYNIYNNDNFEYAGFGFMAITILTIIFYWYISKMEITVTNTRVYGKKAFGKRVDLPLDTISAVGTSFLKGIDIGTSSGRIHFKGIMNNNEIHTEISKLLNNRQSQKQEKVNNNTNTTEELKQYKELLDSGIITQEEFEAKKKQLLGL